MPVSGNSDTGMFSSQRHIHYDSYSKWPLGHRDRFCASGDEIHQHGAGIRSIVVSL